MPHRVFPQNNNNSLVPAYFLFQLLVHSLSLSLSHTHAIHYKYISYKIFECLVTLSRILFAGESFPSSWFHIQAPNVEVLVLNFRSKIYTLPEFVEKMDKLKVMITTNYGFYHAELMNFQLLKSLSNLRRIRLEKVSIPSLFKKVSIPFL